MDVGLDVLDVIVSYWFVSLPAWVGALLLLRLMGTETALQPAPAVARSRE